MLACYGTRLPVVEVNSTFYRRPTTRQLEAWESAVPATFEFAFKASRYFSAGPGLRNALTPLSEFFGLLSRVKAKLGPVLVQWPQHIKKDVPLLRDFLTAIPKGKRVALDLIDASWRCEETHEVLRERSVALCVTESAAVPAFVPTTTWGYFRLRKDRYDTRAVDAWAERLLKAGLEEAYVFFKHDKAGPNHALRLMQATADRL